MEELVGYNLHRKYFSRLIKDGNLSHSYIFSGPEMIGKKSFACEIYGMANAIRDIQAGDPDYRLIGSEGEESDKISIDRMRDLKSFMCFRPYAGPYKFAVIDNAHFLTTEASNAVLKILEEPPSFSVIILVTSLPNSLSETIRSRCQEIKFPKLPDEVIEDFLKDKKIKKEDIEFITKISGGRVGLAVKLLDKDELAISKKNIEDLRKIFKANLADRFNFAKKMAESDNMQLAISDWLSWLYAHKENHVNYAIMRDLLALSRLISKTGLNKRLALENFFISL